MSYVECRVDGCSGRVSGKGLCNKHYQRLLRNGDPLAGRTEEGEQRRFYTEVVLNYEGDDCFTWPYHRNQFGYGMMPKEVGRGRVSVSRSVCRDINGPPPTPKHFACHSCGNGRLGCVSKKHLRWGTQSENEADKLLHGTHQRGMRHWNSKLTEDQVREIISLRGKESLTSIAKRFAVALPTVSNIYNGHTWSWLQETGQ